MKVGEWTIYTGKAKNMFQHWTIFDDGDDLWWRVHIPGCNYFYKDIWPETMREGTRPLVDNDVLCQLSIPQARLLLVKYGWLFHDPLTPRVAPQGWNLKCIELPWIADPAPGLPRVL